MEIGDGNRPGVHHCMAELALLEPGSTSPESLAGPVRTGSRSGSGFVPGGDPESSLAALAMGGDERALHALWVANRRWVAAIILAHKPRWADVEDLLQDVGTTLVRKISELREPGALKPWLRTVAINTARAAARDGGKHARNARLSINDSPDHWGHGRAIGGAESRRGVMDSAAATETCEEANRLMSLAMQLPEGYREPLLLKCLKDLSYRQIGALMGLPESTIETRIARGRRMLRELAQHAGGGGGGASARVTAVR